MDEEIRIKKSELQAIIDTLNKVEVHGSDNLDMLLGCIKLLNIIKNRKDNSTK